MVLIPTWTTCNSLLRVDSCLSRPLLDFQLRNLLCSAERPGSAQNGISNRLSFMMMCPPNRREVQRHLEQQSEAPSLPLTADSVGTSCET
jgi:hypothetical protein